MSNDRLKLCSVASAIIGAAIFLAGCFEMEQTIELRKNGALDFSLHYAVAEKHIPAFRQIHAQIAEWQDSEEAAPEAWILSREAAERHFAGDAFNLRTYKSYTRGDMRHIELAGTAKDGAAALRSGLLGKFELEQAETGGGALSLTPAGRGRKPPLDEPGRKALLEAARGISIRLTIRTPQPVTTTNGEKIGTNEVRWIFGPEILADPQAVPDSMQVAFGE